MSRLLYRLSYPAVVGYRGDRSDQRPTWGGCSAGARRHRKPCDRAPMRNRTADLLLTMETLCLLSYRGADLTSWVPTLGPAPAHKDTRLDPWSANRDEPRTWPAVLGTRRDHPVATRTLADAGQRLLNPYRSIGDGGPLHGVSRHPGV